MKFATDPAAELSILRERLLLPTVLSLTRNQAVKVVAGLCDGPGALSGGILKLLMSGLRGIL